MKANRKYTSGLERVTASGLAYLRPSRTYRLDRVCGFSGCGTNLSRYNPSCRCAIHD
jgi:hypothetical protein